MVARMPGGSASSAFTPYRRQTFLIARSRSRSPAFSTGAAQVPELVGLAEHPACVANC